MSVAGFSPNGRLSVVIVTFIDQTTPQYSEILTTTDRWQEKIVILKL